MVVGGLHIQQLPGGQQDAGGEQCEPRADFELTCSHFRGRRASCVGLSARFCFRLALRAEDDGSGLKVMKDGGGGAGSVFARALKPTAGSSGRSALVI